MDGQRVDGPSESQRTVRESTTRRRVNEPPESLNGQTVDTNGNGIYKIENISPGIHKIRITKDDWLFDESEIQVRSSNPIIGDIKPTKVAVCPKSNSEEVQIQVYEGSGTTENFLTRFKSGKIDCMDLG